MSSVGHRGCDWCSGASPKWPAGCSHGQKASEAWQETHKQWYLPGGGEMVGHNLNKHQILLVQQQTHARTHTHCLIHSNAASCAVTSAYPAQDKFTQSLEHPVHPALVCSAMIFMTWTPAIRETQHHKPTTHAGTQTVNAIPSSPAHSTYKHKKKYRQCKNLLWRSVKSSLDFSPSLCHLSSNPYNQLNGKEISMSSFHATEDQVWHFNLEALAGHTQNNALVRKTNLSPCYKNKQPQWKLFFCVHPLLFESKVSFTGVYLNCLSLQRETSIQCTIQ